MAQMAGSRITGIKQTTFVVTDSSYYTQTVTIPLDEKPYGFLIASDSETGSPYVNFTLLRIGATWTEYNGGQYRPTSCCCVNKSGVQDFYNLNANLFPVYDEETKTLTVKTSGCNFTKDRTYYVWYFTVPFI